MAVCFSTPNHILQIKKSQEKGNDVKRDLLAAGSAVRRQAQQSSPPIENSPEAFSISSSPAPYVLPAREALTTVSLGSILALPAPATHVGPCSLPGGLSVLSSLGFATLNEERTSNQRSRVNIADDDMKEVKRARTKTGKDGSNA